MRARSIILLAVIACSAPAETRRATTVDDVLDLVQVSAPRMSPRHQRVRDTEEIAWLMKYARGIDWTIPQRPADRRGPAHRKKRQNRYL